MLLLKVWKVKLIGRLLWMLVLCGCRVFVFYGGCWLLCDCGNG